MPNFYECTLEAVHSQRSSGQAFCAPSHGGDQCCSDGEVSRMQDNLRELLLTYLPHDDRQTSACLKDLILSFLKYYEVIT